MQEVLYEALFNEDVWSLSDLSFAAANTVTRTFNDCTVRLFYIRMIDSLKEHIFLIAAKRRHEQCTYTLMYIMYVPNPI